MTQETAKTVTFTDSDGDTITASFNGRVYNGKRYINCQYRVNNTRSGLKTSTAVWQDGMGWIEKNFWAGELVKLFGLE